MSDERSNIDYCDDDIIYVRLPICDSQCCSKANWFKIGVNIASVVFYHFAKMHILGCEHVNRDSASFLFLLAITIWLSNINLEPRCLTFYKPLKWFYDVRITYLY